MNLRKLILPVAGLGKRLRPLTLTTPKNLIPLRGKPILEYALEEAVEVGIREVILIVSPEHEPQYEAYLASARTRFPKLTFHVRRQAKPWGNGHAILQAADLLEPGEAFAVRFCDDVILAPEPMLGKLIAHAREYQASALYLMQVPPADVSRYGVVKATATPTPDLYRIWDLVEKPKLEEAPSNLIIIGGYVLSYRVLEHLQELAKGMTQADDALMITDALLKSLTAGEPLYGFEFSGTRLDCGTLDGLKTAEEYMAILSQTPA